MAVKRRQIALILSILVSLPYLKCTILRGYPLVATSLSQPLQLTPYKYLGILTVIAALAAHSSNRLNLPIPNALTTLTLALAPVAGLTIETSNALATALLDNPKARNAPKSTIPPVFLPGTVTIALLLIYETVVATLAGTHIAPNAALICGLQERWHALFTAKDATAVRRIQDTFQCCGLRDASDMAWPFPDGGHGADACLVRYGGDRAGGCLEPWRAEEKRVGALMLVVAIGVFLWMVSIVSSPADCYTILTLQSRSSSSPCQLRSPSRSDTCCSCPSPRAMMTPMRRRGARSTMRSATATTMTVRRRACAARSTRSTASRIWPAWSRAIGRVRRSTTPRPTDGGMTSEG